jgi:DNA-binding NarL/FixJ family response regulator
MNRVSIALVDSSQGFARIAHFLLTTFYPERYELVGSAGTAEEGLALTSAWQPEIVLLDLGLGGYQIIPSLRSAGAGAVICLSTEEAEGYRTAALAAGADAFMLKSEINTVLVPTIQRIKGFT